MLETLLINILWLIIIGIVIWLIFWALDTYGARFLPGPVIIAIKAIIIIVLLIVIVQFLLGSIPGPRPLKFG